MDLSPLILAAVAVTLVLQIVTMVKISKNQPSDKKRDFEGSDGKFNRPSQDLRNKRRDFDRGRDDRKERKDLQPNKPQNQTLPISPVDNSLRDINLRLKNAERDQEKERTRLKDGELRPNPNNNNRSRDPRDNNRDNRRDNRDNRNSRRPPLNNGNRQDNNQERNRPFEERPQQEVENVPPAVIAVVSEPQTTVDQTTSQPADDMFGRNKITVKRRVLDAKPEETEVHNELSEATEQKPSFDSPVSTAEESSSSQPQTPGTDEPTVTFGRR